MSDLTVSLLQTNIIWECPSKNLEKLKKTVETLTGKTNLIVLPEMFTTGFSMNVQSLSESNDGLTMNSLKELSKNSGIAFTGSFIANDKNHYFNRAFFITPNEIFFQDKRHLFRMGKEHEVFSSAASKSIIKYHNWNISLQVCYDLRFPVWCRNINNEYDLLIFMANWPLSRRNVWLTLLQARAIENSSYVIGVNRIGSDPLGNNYSGDSMIVDMKGKIVCQAAFNEECIITYKLRKQDLIDFRNKFPVHLDADIFYFNNQNER